MTKSEAIKKLQAIKSYMTSGNPMWSVEPVGEAMDMAIEALQAKTDGDTISRQDAIDKLKERRALYCDNTPDTFSKLSYAEKSRVDELDTEIATLINLPSAQPERLTDDDFETIRIHLDACKEKLCNQQRWEEAEEYQRIIDRFMSFASAQPGWIPVTERLPEEKDAGILKKLGTEKKSEYVLATVEVKGERMTVTACTHDGKWDWKMKYAFPDFKVVAWMPLPEPWKGEADENMG